MQPLKRFDFFFGVPELAQEALGTISWKSEEFSGGIIAKCEPNGTANSVSVWLYPCATEGIQNLATEVKADRVTDENGNAI